MLGNLAGLAVAFGLGDDEIEAELADRARTMIADAVDDPRGKFPKGIHRAQDRLHFITRT